MKKIVFTEDITLYKADCLEVMPHLPESSIDFILCDPPFGTTASQWDKIIPFSEMWEEIKRVRKENAPTALFGSKPFSCLVRYSNLNEFKYDWVWEKSKASNFLLAKKQSLKAHELISIFCKGKTPYYPIMEEGEPYRNRTKRGSNWTGINNVPNPAFRNENRETTYPRSVKYFKTAESEGKTIPINQKPIALLQYLIKTSTKEGDIVLDFASESMSTAIACIYTNRKCICIKKDEKYFSQEEERVRNEYQYTAGLKFLNKVICK